MERIYSMCDSGTRFLCVHNNPIMSIHKPVPPFKRGSVNVKVTCPIFFYNSLCFLLTDLDDTFIVKKYNQIYFI
jgi:hypothetical protein